MTATSVSSAAGYLSVINPGGQKSRAAIVATPFLIGRQAGNHLVLRDNRVSRSHARILFEQGAHWVEDLHSRHGTYLNGHRIEGREKLLHADSISFGLPDGYQLVFEQGDLHTTRISPGRATGVAGPQTGGFAKLRALADVARAMQASLSVDEVLEAVVDAAMSITGSERGFLLLRDEAGAGLVVRLARDHQGNRLPPGELTVSTRVIERALAGRRELLTMSFDPAVDLMDRSLAAARLRSVVCVPLVKVRNAASLETVFSTMEETTGMLYLDSRIDLGELTQGNRDVLQTLAIEASTVLENARLLEQERAKHRLEEELRIAREIQRTLLPASLPETGFCRVAASSDPTHAVGGDYYDLRRVAPDCWMFVVADVSGKGVSSALMASLLQGAMITGAGDPDGIENLLSRINAYVHERAEGEKYATLFYGALHADGTLHWCGAGHGQAALVLPDGTVERLEAVALPVGMLEDGAFPVSTRRLPAGAKVAVFSDGITDAENAAGEHFGSRRVTALLAAGGAMSALALHGKLVAAVREFVGRAESADDMTALVVEYQP